jgi:hypothetical protein
VSSSSKTAQHKSTENWLAAIDVDRTFAEAPLDPVFSQTSMNEFDDVIALAHCSQSRLGSVAQLPLRRTNRTGQTMAPPNTPSRASTPPDRFAWREVLPMCLGPKT